MNSILTWTAVLLGVAAVAAFVLDHQHEYRYEDLFRVPEPESADWKEIPSDISMEFSLDDPNHV